MKVFSEVSFIEEVIPKIMKQQENIILEQLNDLISRRLLIVEMTTPILTSSENSNKVELSQGIRLVLKDKEYIETLEKRNKELEEMLNNIKKTLNENNSR